MKLAKWILAGSIFMVIPSVTLAQQALTGTVIAIDRISGTISIQQPQGGTVGASSGGATDQFKAPLGALEKVHAGDRVTFSVSDSGDKKTITKIESQ
jgi:hypothetical protein